MSGDKVGMFLAWNGKGSDCAKLFEVTDVLYRGQLFMPEGVKYFADPMGAIKNYKRNPFHESKRTTDMPSGYGLGTIYELMFKVPLLNAHNALADAHGQAKIFVESAVQMTFDLKKNVILMDDVWKGKQASDAEHASELTRAVPLGWSTASLEPSRRYTGPSGGGHVGPTSPVKRACAERSLIKLFLLFFTDTILNMIARETNRYGNEDWVRPVNEEEYRSFYDAAESAEAAQNNGNSNEEDDHDQSPRT